MPGVNVKLKRSLQCTVLGFNIALIFCKEDNNLLGRICNFFNSPTNKSSFNIPGFRGIIE